MSITVRISRRGYHHYDTRTLRRIDCGRARKRLKVRLAAMALAMWRIAS